MNKDSPGIDLGSRGDRVLIEQILGASSPLGRHLSASFEVRPAQLTMARKVMAALQNDGRLVVEAGTGTGKTLAYLVPAVLSEMKVVISTGTHTLQEQIVCRDLPLLLEALDLQIKVACMKGIGNYLCLRRFNELRRQGSLLEDPHLALLEKWAGVTSSGDRAELEALPDDAAIWREVSPSPETRLGSKCLHFEECFVTRMRRQAAAARIVVVNHHLLLADLALRNLYPEACVIPAYEALVLDEAHAIESIATTFFGRSISGETFAVLARDIRRTVRPAQGSDTAKLTDELERRAAELFHLISTRLSLLTVRESTLANTAPRASTSHESTRLRLAEEPLVDELQQPYFLLDTTLEGLAANLHRQTTGREELANLVKRTSSLRENLGLFAEPPAHGYIFWAERRRRGPILYASPVEVGPILAEAMHADPIPMVFTSATLATGPAPAAHAHIDEVRHEQRHEQRDAPTASTRTSGSSALGYFRSRIGLVGPELDPIVDELVLPSPFDFERQALLYVPTDLPPPADARFIFQASERMSQLIDMTAGRALVLFTSYRNLRAAHELLTSQLSYPILCQGTRPRSVLLEAFRKDLSSVLLATASFWEGVDVLGESLSMVIIDKLPFAVPDDPLIAARIELLKERGESPFVSYQLPQALLALKQGFGRLIRHRDDRGVVALLDRRVHERSYGRFLLSNLPPCPRTSDLLRVRAFCKHQLQLQLQLNDRPGP